MSPAMCAGCESLVNRFLNGSLMGPGGMQADHPKRNFIMAGVSRGAMHASSICSVRPHMFNKVLMIGGYASSTGTIVFCLA